MNKITESFAEIKTEFKINADGQVSSSIRGAAQLVGVAESSLREGARNSKSKLAETLAAHEFEAKDFIENGIPFDALVIIARYYAFDSKAKSEKAKEFYFKAKGEEYESPQKEKVRKKTKGSVYIFEASNAIKVGYSRNVQQRLASLQRWPGEIELILTIKGGIKKEQNIHKLLHETGEYFGDEWYPLHRKQEIIKLVQSRA